MRSEIMQVPPTPANEQQRLEALSKYKLSEIADDKIFNQITELASIICDTPICLITIIEQNKQWFLSNHGLEHTVETPRDLSFCAHAINDNKLMEITDTILDERFQDNPFVVNHPKIRFYAGMPLVDSEGYKLGTICVIDKKERELNKKQEKTLELFSKMIINIFENRPSGSTPSYVGAVEIPNEIENFKNTLIQSMSEGVMAVAQSGKIFFTNEKANEIFGYPDKKLLSQNFFQLFKDKEIDLSNVKTLKAEAIKNDASHIPVEMTISPLKESKHFVIVFNQIT